MKGEERQGNPGGTGERLDKEQGEQKWGGCERQGRAGMTDYEWLGSERRIRAGQGWGCSDRAAEECSCSGRSVLGLRHQ